MKLTDRHAALEPLSAVIDDGRSLFLGCNPKFDCLNIWYENIRTHVLTRGLNILLIDFPKVGKLFDKGLSSGIIDVKSLPSSFSVEGPLYRHLLMEVADQTGTIVDDDPDVIFFIRTILYLYKKVKLECPHNTLVETINDFVEIEKGLKEPSGSWHSDTWIQCRYTFGDSPDIQDIHPRGRRIWETVDHVFGRLTPSIELRPSAIVPRHGPGAVADLKRGEDKFTFPFWPNKLGSVFSAEEFAFHSNHFVRGSKPGLDHREPPARLIAVPKTYSGPRLIASEPTAHQFLQQGLMRWIRTNLHPVLRASIDFKSQEPSREAALLASLDGKIATVDLSSASDRLTCWVVERAFSSNQTFLKALHAVRTRCIIDATGVDPDLSIRIKKFAAQGSAVTFPVQSIIYAGLCIAALAFVDNIDVTKRRNLLRLARKVRVFGDDIVIPSHAVPILYAMLDSIQLKVNVQKTHTSGHFRESCGMDAYKGYDVTPCYLQSWQYKQSPDSHQSWIDVSNNAFRKGLWNLAKWMDGQIPTKVSRLSLTTRAEGDGARFFTFCDGYVTESRVRFDKNLHEEQVLVLVHSSFVRKKQRGNWQDLHQYFVETPRPDSDWTSGYLTSVSSKLSKRWVRAR